MAKKKSTERVRAFRERKRANKPPKNPPKSSLVRNREYRARLKALKELGGQHNLETTSNILDASVASLGEDIECVMIKQEPDIDLDYDACESNTIDNVDEDDNVLAQPDDQPTMYHGTYLPHLNIDPLTNKRKADDRFQTVFPTVNSIYSLSTDVHPQPPPNKKPARSSQAKDNSKKTNSRKKEEEDGENALRIKYLMNASKTEEQMRSLQMELNKARLEREKMELENIREMHRLQLENLKLEKEILSMKLKNVTEQGVGVV